MKDELGRRLKRDYEDAFRLTLPRRSYVIIRVDGRAFHTFTRNLERPYSRPLADALDEAALRLCREVIGCRFAFGQSDEYSFLTTDLPPSEQSRDSGGEVWFDGNVQKIVSVAASLFTAAFNHAFPSAAPASFDARVFLISQPSEVASYFLWRQLDASANSLNMLASAHFSHDELLGKTTAEKHDLLHRKGFNWAKEPDDFKRGRVVRSSPDCGWVVDRAVPIFSRDPNYLGALIPGLS